jgi:hypothetical protein
MSYGPRKWSTFALSDTTAATAGVLELINRSPQLQDHLGIDEVDPRTVEDDVPR